MGLRGRQVSGYVTGEGVGAAARVRRAPHAFLPALLAIFLIFSTLLNVYAVPTAVADDDDVKDTLSEMANDYFVTDGEDAADLFATLKKAMDEADDDSFGGILRRFFSTDYINETPRASNANGANCSLTHPHAGTPLYHNCDIPTIGTEFVQDILSIVTQTGPKGARVTSSKLYLSQFGLPDNIPGEGAPVLPADRQAKYTGLEVYGYNLRFTTYGGEWDHIKVMTSGRAMANFGGMDVLKLSASAVFNSVATSMETVTTNFLSRLSSGQVFVAIGGLFTDPIEVGSSSVVNTVLDTSEQNVVNSYAWYRVGYGKTLYNARELTTEEVAANAKAQMVEMILGTAPEEAQVPEDLAGIADGLPVPREAISKCLITDATGREVEWGETQIAPGPSEADCEAQAEKVMADTTPEPTGTPTTDDEGNTVTPSPEPVEIVPVFTWDEEGTQVLETLAEWKENNSATLATAASYGIDCEIPENEDQRVSIISNQRVCWDSAYPTAVNDTLLVEQELANTEWLDETMSPDSFQKWVSEDPSRNFNAPWNRFICLDENGRDMVIDGKRVMAFSHTGSLDPRCDPVRPPIQNGFFGNGYPASVDVPLDTRAPSTAGAIASVFHVDTAMSSVANVGIFITSTVTRISNTMMGLAFAAPLATLGIDTLVVSVIEILRDSIFFPLVVLMVAVAGIMAFWTAGVRREYGRQITSLLLMALTVMVGTFIMFLPSQAVALVDEVPATLERTIVGSIFAVGNSPDDQLCTATSGNSGPVEVGDEGAISYSASTGTRSLLCENWRTFAFSPWVFGQFGTNFASLYSAESGMPNTLKNTNGALVGDASVNLGGGFTVQNWALYQLDATSSGTASFDDPTSRWSVNPDFYRIIDAQAGPNNGAGTDGRFFEMWSGRSGFERMFVAALSSIVAVVGAVTVAVYSFAKIQIAFVTTFMLMILPIMLLVGIHPTLGRGKLKAYAGQIAGLMVQRVVLVLLLSVMFRVLSGVGSVTTDYLLMALLSVVICVIFLMIRKQVMDMIFTSVSSMAGAPVGERFMKDPRGFVADQGLRSSFVANRLALARGGVSAMASGAVGGFISGGLTGAKSGVTSAMEVNLDRMRNQQRRRGYGPLQSILDARNEGKQEAERLLGDRRREENEADWEGGVMGYGGHARKEALMSTDAWKEYESELAQWNDNTNPERRNADGSTYKETSDGGRIAKPKKPSLATDNTRRTRQQLSIQAGLMRQIEADELALEKNPTSLRLQKRIKKNKAHLERERNILNTREGIATEDRMFRKLEALRRGIGNRAELDRENAKPDVEVTAPERKASGRVDPETEPFIIVDEPDIEFDEGAYSNTLPEDWESSEIDWDFNYADEPPVDFYEDAPPPPDDDQF